MTNRGQLPHLCLSSITSQLHTLKLLLFIRAKEEEDKEKYFFLFIQIEIINK